MMVVFAQEFLRRLITKLCVDFICPDILQFLPSLQLGVIRADDLVSRF